MKRSSKHNENNTTQWKARGFRSSSDVEKGNSESNPSPRQTEKPPKVFAVPAGFKKSRLLNQECEEKSPISEVTDSSMIPKPTKPKTSEAKQRPTNKSSKKIKKEVKKPEGEASEEVVGQGKEEENPNPNKRKKQKFQGYTLFIGNLSYDTTKEDIQNHFAKCGAIKNVRIPLDKATNQSRGFGYIEVEEHVTYEVFQFQYFSIRLFNNFSSYFYRKC